MNNNLNNCCCSTGIKRALCILKNMNSSFSTNTFYTYGSSNGTIENNPCSNLILLKEKTRSISLCVENINYIEITPSVGMYQSIIYELGKEYPSPFCIEFPNNENCCCKESNAMYMKNKYLEFEPKKRKFSVEFNGLNVSSSTISQQTIKDVYVLYLDCYIAWLCDDTKIYLVSLCNISLFID